MRLVHMLLAAMVGVMGLGLEGCAGFDHTKNSFVIGKTTRGEIETKAGAPSAELPYQANGKLGDGSQIYYPSPYVDKAGINHGFEVYQFDKNNILTAKEPN